MLKFLENRDEVVDLVHTLSERPELKDFKLGVAGSYVTGLNKKASAIDIVLKLREGCNKDLIGDLDISFYIHQHIATAYSNKINGLFSEINDAKIRRSKLIDKYESKLEAMKNDYLDKIEKNETSCSETVKKTEDEKLQLARQRDFALAELRAIRVENGLMVPSEDLTSRERFEELEREFESFNRFFKQQWLITKKAIRKELLWTKVDKYELKAKIKEEKEIKAKEKENRKNGVVSTKETEVLDLSHYTDDLDTKKISDEILVEVAKEDISKELKELENGTLEIEEVNEDKE